MPRMDKSILPRRGIFRFMIYDLFTWIFFRCWMKQWVNLVGKMVMCGNDDFMGKVCILASTSGSRGFMLLSRSSKITIKTAT